MRKLRGERTTSDLFELASSMPAGFKYKPEILPEEEERELVAHFADLPFKPFEFHGYVGNRRTLTFGWHYDFGTRELRAVDEIPPFLLPLRARCAGLAVLTPSELRHALVTEYAPGAGIYALLDGSVMIEDVHLSAALA